MAKTIATDCTKDIRAREIHRSRFKERQYTMAKKLRFTSTFQSLAHQRQAFFGIRNMHTLWALRTTMPPTQHFS